MIGTYLKPHDIAALMPIIEGAGGLRSTRPLASLTRGWG